MKPLPAPPTTRPSRTSRYTQSWHPGSAAPAAACHTAPAVKTRDATKIVVRRPKRSDISPANGAARAEARWKTRTTRDFCSDDCVEGIGKDRRRGGKEREEVGVFEKTVPCQRSLEKGQIRKKLDFDTIRY